MTGYTNDESVLPAGRCLPLQAKQRASILWLLSKACDSVIPPDLREPYYKDHDGEDRLKPYIVQALASGELYCMALSNIYADPNYNNLNHTGIIGVLMRKGIYVQEPQGHGSHRVYPHPHESRQNGQSAVSCLFLSDGFSFSHICLLPISPHLFTSLPCMLSLPLLHTT